MSLKLKFVQLDVFTTTPYLGNPLAIVHIPEGVELSQTQKQRIALEFNLSETVFLHETSTKDAPVAIDIFTPTAELPFAGHPTIGTGWYLLSQPGVQTDTVTLKTKAGEIPVIRKGNGVSLQVPIDFKVHGSTKQDSLKDLQPRLADKDYKNGKGGAEAVASIVKGMTFVLLELSSEEALEKMQPFASGPCEKPADIGPWSGYMGLYAFFERADGVLRTRMFDGPLEDPATGSAASTLGGWLGKNRKGTGKWDIEIVQGVEMGRKSEISVQVEVGSDGEVDKIKLGGTAVDVMEGFVRV
ncbi:hypothetical protein H0H93_005009 [Arthromyces matolae]|nr:hypothetical protein H0H93_005009 [Arthromyces matolae]